jgi:DNA replication protein DnaC
MVSRKVLKDYFEYIRSEAERENYARIDEVCAKVPEMRDIYTQENELTNAVISITPGVDSRDKMQRLREQRRSLEERKREVLRRSGYPEDYLERKYKCGICKDTGYTDEGRTCTCCRERAEEAYKWIQRTKN